MIKELNTVLHCVSDGVYLTKDMMKIIGYEVELAGKYLNMEMNVDIDPNNRYFTIYYKSLLVCGFTGRQNHDNIGSFMEAVLLYGENHINALYEEVIDLSYAMWELREKNGEETREELVLRKKIDIVMVVLNWVTGDFYNFFCDYWEYEGKEHLEIAFYNDITTEEIFEVSDGKIITYFKSEEEIADKR